MLRALPRAVVARYAPPLLKHLMRATWRRAQLLLNPPRTGPLHVFGGRAEYAPGTGRELYAREPAFRQAVDECERITTGLLGGPSLLANFTAAPAPDFFADETQVMHFSVVFQLALVAMWRAQGLQPAATLGVSLGEIVAVYSAGGLSLTDALRVSLCCQVVSQVEPPAYGVLVVNAGLATVGELAAGCPAELFVVLVLSADSCFAMCPLADFAAVGDYLASHGVPSQALRTAPMWPYHATRLARHLAALREPLRGLQPQPLARPCYLATVGRLVPAGTVLGPEHWPKMLLYPVDVHGALAAALADGYRVLVPFGLRPFPFYPLPAYQHVLGGAQLLPAFQPEVPEWESFGTMRRALASQGLLRPRTPVAAPVASAAIIAGLNLRAPDVVASPYASYAWLRQQGGLHFIPAEHGWLVLDYDLISHVLREPLLFSSTIASNFDEALIGADPPIHTGTRALLQSSFSPKEIGPLNAFTQAMVAELAAAARARPAFDFVADFAIPLTQAVSAQLLGLTPDERRQLQSVLPGPVYGLGYLGELTAFFENYLQQPPVAEPTTILAQLVAHVHSGRLTMLAALGLAKTMWLASITTSSIVMSGAAQYLLTHPTEAAELRAQPELADAFVEEILRLEPPLTTVWRVTTEPVVLGGQALPAGTNVICCLSAANRDPTRYPEPDELDLRRRPTRHLAFGGGVHACLGAHLARLEARLVVQWLLAEGASLRLTQPAALPTYFPNATFRALAELPVSLQPLAPAGSRP